jgi:hypothetical protein
VAALFSTGTLLATILPDQPQTESSAIGDEKRLRYSLSAVQFIAAVLFFGLGGLFMAYKAATNHRGLVIDGIIHFSPDGASTFDFIISAVSFAFVGFAIFYVLPQMFISRTIILGRDTITLPGGGFDKSHYRVTPAEIVSAKLTVIRGRRFLKIYTAERNYSINATWLDNPGELSEILRWLQTCAPGCIL